MLIPTMNDSEKRKQAIEDSIEIKKHYAYILQKKLSKEVRKYSKFPRLLKSSYITKNNNKYYLIIRAVSRNSLDGAHWCFIYTIMDSDEGKYAMIAVNQPTGIESFQIYAPHLFARYTERHGVKMYEEERIHKFMEDSASLDYGGVREYEKGKVMSMVHGGAILGDIEGDIIVFKTFVDSDRLREEQLEIGDIARDRFNKRVELCKSIYKMK